MDFDTVTHGQHQNTRLINSQLVSFLLFGPNVSYPCMSFCVLTYCQAELYHTRCIINHFAVTPSAFSFHCYGEFYKLHYTNTGGGFGSVCRAGCPLITECWQLNRWPLHVSKRPWARHWTPNVSLWQENTLHSRFNCVRVHKWKKRRRKRTAHTNKHRKALCRIAIGQKILYLPLHANTAVWAGEISGISLRQHILNRALKPWFLAFLFTTLFRCTVVLSCYLSTMYLHHVVQENTCISYCDIIAIATLCIFVPLCKTMREEQACLRVRGACKATLNKTQHFLKHARKSLLLNDETTRVFYRLRQKKKKTHNI